MFCISKNNSNKNKNKDRTSRSRLILRSVSAGVNGHRLLQSIRFACSIINYCRARHVSRYSQVGEYAVPCRLHRPPSIDDEETFARESKTGEKTREGTAPRMKVAPLEHVTARVRVKLDRATLYVVFSEEDLEQPMYKIDNQSGYQSQPLVYIALTRTRTFVRRSGCLLQAVCTRSTVCYALSVFLLFEPC